jgi:hypothetical protein
MQTGKELPNWKGGIPLDLLDCDYEIIANSFKCLYCEKLVYNPITCDQCKEIFCLSCYLVTNKCKKCDKSTTFSQIEISEKRLLSKIQGIKCLNEKFGCSTIVSYDNIASHLWKQCMYSFKCQECGFKSSMIQAPIHTNECKKKIIQEKKETVTTKNNNPKELIIKKEPLKEDSISKEKPKPIKIPEKTVKNKNEVKKVDKKVDKKLEDENLFCTKCNSYLFKNMTMEEHLFSYCEKNTFNCSFCKQNIISCDREAHLLKCGEFLINCEDCSSTVNKKSFPFHNEGRCFMKMLLFYENYRNLKFERYESILKQVEEANKGKNNEDQTHIKKEFLNKKNLRQKKEEIKENESCSYNNEYTNSSEIKAENKKEANLIKPRKLRKVIIEDE